MKNIFLLLGVLTGFSLQAQWQGSFGSYSYQDIAFLSPTNGVAVGNSPGLGNAAITRTYNGGAGWNSITLNTSYDLYSVCAVPPSDYYACGPGVIYRSKNSGYSWTQLTLPAGNIDYFQIKFIDTLIGFVSTGSVYKTVDGGGSWSLFGRTNADLTTQNLGVASASRVFLTANKELYRTFNSGASWDTLTYTQMGISTAESIVKIWWSDSTQVFLATRDTGSHTKVYRSINTGNSWTNVFSHTKNFHDLTSLDATHLALVLTNMDLYISNNQGVTWSYVNASTNALGAIRHLAYPVLGKVFGIGVQSLGFGIFSLGNLPVSITEPEEVLDNALLYPNPATNQLTINLNGLQAEQIGIYNIDGKLVSEIKQPIHNSIDVSNLAKGVYVAEIKVGDAMQRVRWIKM